MNTLIEVCKLNFSYGTEKVLENVNFSLKECEFWAIIGPNGGGKSTFLKLILGLLKPQSGHIISHLKPHEIGYVPQNTHAHIQFPIYVHEVVGMGLFGIAKRKKKESILQALEDLEIAYLANKTLNELSGGERQRVLIARALVNYPRVLILDEPTAHVDVRAQEGIYQLLQRLSHTCAIMVVSHDLALTLGYAKKLLHINQQVTFHEVPTLPKSALDSHLCEVELLAHFAPEKWEEVEKRG